MGEVRATHDARLDRTVAMKVAHDPELEVRFGREASLTARLDHPSIPPVLDAGRLPDGRAYYTMPVVQGRTLQRALEGTPDLQGRLRLVRHVLDACDAVAHAHAAGILHRDLKPDNVLIGLQGGTRVVDWGLALTLDEALDGGGGGTPHYASPEQRTGAPMDARTDVFGLGRTLRRVLEGPQRGRLPPDAPPELVAIAGRAAALAPADRYPSAVALGEDLSAWFEGRQVQAYSYTHAERLARRLVAWRRPLAVALAGGLVAAGVATAGWWTTARERDRALTAESATADARTQAEDHLAHALVARARESADRGRRAATEQYAAAALVLRPSPGARGLLARTLDRPRPHKVAEAPLPTCSSWAVTPDGTSAVCAAQGEVRLFELAPGVATERGRWPLDARDLAFSGPDGVALATDGGLYRITPAGLTPAGESRRNKNYLGDSSDPAGIVQLGGNFGLVRSAAGDTPLRCANQRGPLAVWLAPDRPPLFACPDGRVLSGDEAWTVLAPSEGLPATLVVSGPVALIGSTTGVLVRLDTANGAMGRVQVHDGPVRDLAIRGDDIAVAGPRGDVTLWSLETLTEWARVPSAPVRVRWLDNGHLRTIADTSVDWALARATPAHQLELHEGVSALAFGPEGKRIAIGTGDGRLELRRVADGQRVAAWQLGDVAVKDAEFAPDGSLLAAAAGARGLARLVPGEPPAVLGPLARTYRRFTRLADGSLLAATYNDGVYRFPESAGPSDPDAPDSIDTLPFSVPIVDLEPAPDHRSALLMDQQGTVWRTESTGTADPLPGLPDVALMTPTTDGAIYVRVRDLVHLRDGTLQPPVPHHGGPALDARTSPDGRWLAIGHYSGTVTVWRLPELTLAAELTGHHAQVSVVAFDPTGRWLATGGWDAKVYLWALEALTADPVTLQASLDAAWGPRID
ncbi:MAG: WD40 repeat protein [Myxococcota bacterium]|jgi:WD40 repeat protein